MKTKHFALAALILFSGGLSLQAQTSVSATSTATTSETKTPPASSKKPLPEAQWVEKSKTTTCDKPVENKDGKLVEKPRDAKAAAENTGTFIKPTSQTETKTTVTTVKPVPKKEVEKSTTSTTSGS